MMRARESFWQSGEPGLFDDPRVLAASDLAAMLDLEEGRTISHAAVRRWLDIWGTADATRPPIWG